MRVDILPVSSEVFDYHHQHRHYAAQLGRFRSRDPIGAVLDTAPHTGRVSKSCVEMNMK